MSLLLDALKEAEKRKGEAPAGAPLRREAPSMNEMPDETKREVRGDTPLSLADEPEAPALASAAAASPAYSPPQGRLRPEAAAPQITARMAPHAASTKSPATWLRGALLAVAVLVAGVVYWMLFRQPAMTLPALAAPVTTIQQGQVAQTVEIAAADPPTPPMPAEGQLQTTVGETEHSVAERSVPATVQRIPVTDEGALHEPLRGPPIIIQGRASPLVAAHAALRSGDLQRAEQLYRETLVGEPDQPDAHLGLALIDQSRNATAEALAHYRMVLSRRPTDAQAWAGIADLSDESDQDAMESRLRDLLAEHKDPALHFALGNLLARQARWPEAQERYFSAVSGAPLNADYAFNLAVALDKLGKPGAAIARYSRALELASEVHGVQFDVAAVQARMKQLQAGNP
ncbi:MAG: tetratricopeptide repeat protein [Pseudomonadota bacterium]